MPSARNHLRLDCHVSVNLVGDCWVTGGSAAAPIDGKLGIQPDVHHSFP